MTTTVRMRAMARWLTRLALAAALSGSAAMLAAETAWADRALVRNAKSWRYQLQGDVGGLASSNVDVVAVDLDGAKGSVARLKQKPGGGRRAVLAYIAIGEAEPWRPYWKTCCAGGSPSWLTSRIQGWKNNYVVRFWEPGWKAIVAQRVREAMAAGFDGLYLDRVDTWENISAPAGSRAAMISFVREVAAVARSIRGNAAILVQNGEELLTSDSYVDAIDAIAKEDLIHGINHDGKRNASADISWSLSLLKRAQARGKTIFVVEYLSGSSAERVAAEIRKHGFVPNFAPRSLTR
jgi:cysteinyl-tRNA synthetase